MNGTWQGTFSSTNTGEIVVEIDDVGDHFRGCAYAYDASKEGGAISAKAGLAIDLLFAIAQNTAANAADRRKAASQIA